MRVTIVRVDEKGTKVADARFAMLAEFDFGSAQKPSTGWIKSESLARIAGTVDTSRNWPWEEIENSIFTFGAWSGEVETGLSVINLMTGLS